MKETALAVDLVDKLTDVKDYLLCLHMMLVNNDYRTFIHKPHLTLLNVCMREIETVKNELSECS